MSQPGEICVFCGSRDRTHPNLVAGLNGDRLCDGPWHPRVELDPEAVFCHKMTPAGPLDAQLTVIRACAAQGYPDMGLIWWSALKTWLEGLVPAAGAPETGEREKVLGEVLLVMTTLEEAGHGG